MIIANKLGCFVSKAAVFQLFGKKLISHDWENVSQHVKTLEQARRSCELNVLSLS